MRQLIRVVLYGGCRGKRRESGWEASHLRPDVVIGGPPCQGFSVIGRMDPKDPRSEHVHCYLDIVQQLEPRAFCMENVKALAASPWCEPIRDALIQRARELEYQVELLLLNAADYGVP